MVCEQCEEQHPTKGYYQQIGFKESTASLIVEGFHADDVLTEKEFIEQQYGV